GNDGNATGLAGCLGTLLRPSSGTDVPRVGAVATLGQDETTSSVDLGRLVGPSPRVVLPGSHPRRPSVGGGRPSAYPDGLVLPVLRSCGVVPPRSQGGREQGG